MNALQLPLALVCSIILGACSSQGGTVIKDGGDGSGDSSAGGSDGSDSGGGSPAVDAASDASDVSDVIDAFVAVDGFRDSSFTNPPGLDPEGLASCDINNPAIGGGCECRVMKKGHLYQAYCDGDVAPCICAVDGTPTKTIPNICPSFGGTFIHDCGFP